MLRKSRNGHTQTKADTRHRTKMTAELARLQQSVKKDPNKKRPVRNTSRIWVPQVFRFLDLPSEVRNEVYEYFIRKDSILRLRCFKLPAICRTSRQLRQESLPLFFARNHFVVEVRTNFEGVSICPSHGSHVRYIDVNDKPKCQALGRLDLSSVVQRMLAICDSRTIRIRHIDFCMVAADPRVRREQDYRFAILSIRHQRSAQVSAVIKEGRNHEYTEQLRRVLDQGRQLLEMIIDDGPYSGLSMRQLRELASTFVLDPQKRVQDWKMGRLQRREWVRVRPAGASVKADVVDLTEPEPEPDVSKAHGATQAELLDFTLPSQDAAEQQPATEQARSLDTDEYGLDEAESYFADYGYEFISAESSSTSMATTEVDEFDMPEAEYYFGSDGAVRCCTATSITGQSAAADKDRQHAVASLGEADVEEFGLADAESYFA